MTDSRNLLARTADYLLWTEDHLSKSVIYQDSTGQIRVPALQFKYAIRRPNGDLVFRLDDVDQATDLLYQLSARLRPLGASVPAGLTDPALPQNGDGRAETAEVSTQQSAGRSLIGRQGAPAS